MPRIEKHTTTRKCGGEGNHVRAIIFSCVHNKITNALTSIIFWQFSRQNLYSCLPNFKKYILLLLRASVMIVLLFNIIYFFNVKSYFPGTLDRDHAYLTIPWGMSCERYAYILDLLWHLHHPHIQPCKLRIQDHRSKDFVLYYFSHAWCSYVLNISTVWNICTFHM